MMSSRLRELGFTLPIYSIGGALAFLSVLVFRKRSGVPRWWAAAVFIPFLVWVTISDLADRGRSLATLPVAELNDHRGAVAPGMPGCLVDLPGNLDPLLDTPES